jgi:hypothetical protein
LPSEVRRWVGGHKQRILYALAAFSLCAAVGAATVGGFLLHRAADVERQALRTQELAGAVAQLQDFPSRVEAEGATPRLVESHLEAVAATNRLFRNVRAHDRAESDRIRAAYLAYISGTTSEFNPRHAERPHFANATQSNQSKAQPFRGADHDRDSSPGRHGSHDESGSEARAHRRGRRGGSARRAPQLAVRATAACGPHRS